MSKKSFVPLEALVVVSMKKYESYKSQAKKIEQLEKEVKELLKYRPLHLHSKSITEESAASVPSEATGNTKIVLFLVILNLC